MSSAESTLVELHRLLGRLAEELESSVGGAAADADPPLDIVMRDDSVEIRIELPGLTPADVQVSLAVGRLVLSGSKQASSPAPASLRPRHHRMERRRGSFAREIPLPPSLDLSRARAELSGGLLLLHIPRLEERRLGLREIEIVDLDLELPDDPSPT